MALESYRKYSASCPGSLMIMGEHAVLYGSPCIVAAIDKYLTVTLQTTSKKQQHSQIEIITDIDKFSASSNVESYSNIVFNIEEIEDRYTTEPNKFLYLLAVIKYFKKEILASNLDYKFIITSEINPSMGLGSSAAVTAASINVVLKALDQEIDNKKILAIGLCIIRETQGNGSGADLAASVYGRVIMYQMLDQQVEVIADKIPLTVIYCGYKLSTKEVIKIIADNIANNSQLYKEIFRAITSLVSLAQKYTKNQDWPELGKLFNQHYGLQEALGTSDKNLSRIVYGLRAESEIYGAKISGSGLGDCVIGLGKVNHVDNIVEGSQYLDIMVSERGMQLGIREDKTFA